MEVQNEIYLSGSLCLSVDIWAESLRVDRLTIFLDWYKIAGGGGTRTGGTY